MFTFYRLRCRDDLGEVCRQADCGHCASEHVFLYFHPRGCAGGHRSEKPAAWRTWRGLLKGYRVY